MRKAVSKSGSKNPLSTALWSIVVLTLGISVSACSGDHEEEILAVDRVEQAADIARQNAPAAEDMEFPEVAPMVTAAVEPAVDMEDAEMSAAAVPVEDAGAAEGGLALEVGAQIYNKQCVACHASGILGSPKYGDAAAWAPRIAKGKETLYTHAANGFNQMNAQVNAEVSAEQVHAAVDYMVAAAS